MEFLGYNRIEKTSVSFIINENKIFLKQWIHLEKINPYLSENLKKGKLPIGRMKFIITNRKDFIEAKDVESHQFFFIEQKYFKDFLKAIGNNEIVLIDGNSFIGLVEFYSHREVLYIRPVSSDKLILKEML